MNDCLCETGLELREAWQKAVDDRDREEIRFWMTRYFTHRNTCTRCCSAKLLEQNHELNPLLFKAVEFEDQS